MLRFIQARSLQVTWKDLERSADEAHPQTLLRSTCSRKMACLGELFKLKDCNFSNFQKLSNCPSTQRSRHALIEFNFFLNKKPLSTGFDSMKTVGVYLHPPY